MTPLWWLSRDGDKTLIELYERHYSCYEYRDGRGRTQFVGPGETVVLRTLRGDAMFVWRKFIDDSVDERTGKAQQGVNCAVFRNEGAYKSSDLLRQADAIADFCWPRERHYTYVDAAKVASPNPGYCFQVAGWHKCGKTKSGLIVLEKLNAPEREAEIQKVG